MLEDRSLGPNLSRSRGWVLVQPVGVAPTSAVPDDGLVQMPRRAEFRVRRHASARLRLVCEEVQRNVGPVPSSVSTVPA